MITKRTDEYFVLKNSKNEYFCEFSDDGCGVVTTLDISDNNIWKETDCQRLHFKILEYDSLNDFKVVTIKKVITTEFSEV